MRFQLIPAYIAYKGTLFLALTLVVDNDGMAYLSKNTYMQLTNAHDFSDFLPTGYKVIEELGHNKSGGRITYKAINVQTQNLVVIKQFQFNSFDSNWSGFKAYEREIEVLRSLEHPGIPQYIDAFETSNGFCMVQEYKDARNLAVTCNFNQPKIEHIAVSVLEILVYLQNCTPPVIHRDIKPENILIDDEGHVTLVDFGFARSRGEEMSASSVVVGTHGFMPPEQLFNRQLTLASDLYSLGATLVCLLARIESTTFADSLDEVYKIDVKDLLPDLDSDFRQWIEKMVAFKTRDRFDTATIALAALTKISSKKAIANVLEPSEAPVEVDREGKTEAQTLVRCVGQFLPICSALSVCSLFTIFVFKAAISLPSNPYAGSRLINECVTPLGIAENAETIQNAKSELSRGVTSCSKYNNFAPTSIGLSALKTERELLIKLSSNSQNIEEYKKMIKRERLKLRQKACNSKERKMFFCS